MKVEKYISKSIDICFFLLLFVALLGVIYEATTNLLGSSFLPFDSINIYNLAVLIATISPIIINITFLVASLLNKKFKKALISFILLLVVTSAIIIKVL